MSFGARLRGQDEDRGGKGGGHVFWAIGVLLLREGGALEVGDYMCVGQTSRGEAAGGEDAASQLQRATWICEPCGASSTLFLLRPRSLPLLRSDTAP